MLSAVTSMSSLRKDNSLQNKSAALKNNAAAAAVPAKAAQLASLPTSMILAQRSKVAFRANNPILIKLPSSTSELAALKTHYSDLAEIAAKKGDNLAVATAKLITARICRQTKGEIEERNAHLLEETAHGHIMKAVGQGHIDGAKDLLRNWATYFEKELGRWDNAAYLRTTAQGI